MTITLETMKRAVQIRKVIRLCGEPGMDAVAVRLNCGLSYEDEQDAKRWLAAISVVSEHPDLPLSEQAARYRELTR